jgi:flagellar biosynthesis GTPase FlhF
MYIIARNCFTSRRAGYGLWIREVNFVRRLWHVSSMYENTKAVSLYRNIGVNTHALMKLCFRDLVQKLACHVLAESLPSIDNAKEQEEVVMVELSKEIHNDTHDSEQLEGAHWSNRHMKDIYQWHSNLCEDKDITSQLNDRLKIHDASLKALQTGLMYKNHPTLLKMDGLYLIIPFFGPFKIRSHYEEEEEKEKEEEIKRLLLSRKEEKKAVESNKELMGFSTRELSECFNTNPQKEVSTKTHYLQKEEHDDDSSVSLGLKYLTDRPSEVWIMEDEFEALIAHSMLHWEKPQKIQFPTFLIRKQRHDSISTSLQKDLKSASKIVLCLRDDHECRTMSLHYAQKLGKEQCYMLRLSGGNPKGPKTFIDMTRQNLYVSSWLQKIYPICSNKLLSFREVREEVREELANPDAIKGIPSRTLPGLTRILKGFRRGEVTIFTGPTGVGKTSLLCQLSLDFCVQGVPTLWGSFEIKATRLIKKMLHQFVGKNMEQHLHEFNMYADTFEQLPLYFMRFYGGTSIDRVLETMEYSVLVNNVQHIVIDNLQFMMNSAESISYQQDRFAIMDQVIHKFRMFASDFNVHLSIVIHPRKENDDILLSTSSIYGSAKATQEADNVIAIQKRKEKRYLDILKNRFDGDTGTVYFQYIKDTQMVSG